MYQSGRQRNPRPLRVLVVGSIFLVGACATPPNSMPKCEAATVFEASPGVFVRSGHSAVSFEADTIANIGFIVGDRCVAVVDTGGSPAEGAALGCAVRERTNRPVCYVINTHVHPDHMLGNQAFHRPGVEFVGHAKLPRALALRGDTYLERAAAYLGTALPQSTLIFPERTIDGAVELDIGNRILMVRAHASAHTDHDLSVFDVKTQTVFVGDLVFQEHLPVIDGSINGWINELEAMSHDAFVTVIPGHGSVDASWPAAMEPTRAYLQELRQNVRDWISAEGELAGAQRDIGSANAARWALFERYHRRNIAAAFAELEWED